MKNFKDIKAWQLGKLIATEVHKLFDHPDHRQPSVFATLVIEVSVAIPGNIAKGNSKRSNRDFGGCVEIALGSAFELETQLIIMQELGVGDPEKVKELMDLIVEEQKLLYALLRKLNYEHP